MTILRPITILDLKDLLGRALLEPTFRERLLISSDRVLTELGIQPDEKSRRFFETLQNESFANAAGLIDPDVSPRPPIIHWN